MDLKKKMLVGAGATLAIAAISFGAVKVVSEYRADGSDAPASDIAFQPNPNSRQYGTDDQIARLQAQLEKTPDDFAANLALSGMYLQKIRETGDPSLYAKAEDLLDKAGKLGPNNPDYFASRAMFDQSRHQFGDALGWAKKAVDADPERARYYGILADAQLELGMYEDAVNSLQQQVDRRPEFSAFSRIAYARELYGDPEGAVEAFTQAIDAGTSVPENLAYAYVQRGNLEWGMNASERATADYEAALQVVAEYPPALAGKGRIAAAAGNVDEARSLYSLAFERMPLAEYAVALGELEQSAGNMDAAKGQFDLVRAIDTLQSQNGVNTDLEVALFLADHDADHAAAVARARAAYKERPNIHAADALAWALYQSGNPGEAEKYATEALRLGTRDSLKLFHAGMIFKANGKTDEARVPLFDALRFNPAFSVLYAGTAREALTSIGGALPAAAVQAR